jgi:hypothetical protein
MNFLQNPIIFVSPLIGKRPRTALKSLAPEKLARQGLNGDFDLLAFGNAGVFVEFNRPAVDFAVYNSGHSQ